MAVVNGSGSGFPATTLTYRNTCTSPSKDFHKVYKVAFYFTCTHESATCTEHDA